MSRIIDSGLSIPDPIDSGPSGSKKHFDTFETQFFQEGDESERSAAEAERFDDLDDGIKRKKFAPSRQFTMSVVVGSTCLAIIGCVAFWRSGNRSTSPALTSDRVAAVSTAQTDPPPPVAVAPPTQPAPAPASPQAPEQPVPVVVQAAPAQAIPSGSLAPVPPAAQPVAVQKPAAVAPEAAKEETKPAVAVAAEAKPTLAVAAEVKPALAVAEEAKAQSATVVVGADASVERCKKAIGQKHGKEILSSCADAFAADPSAADFAVALARIEFDRGRTAQALAWGKKAVAADPNVAEAYVFIGGAEQSAGHGKAAKEAYRRYLQLAPGGHYAADLRAIVGSL